MLRINSGANNTYLLYFKLEIHVKWVYCIYMILLLQFLILLTTTLATSVQMKQHPYVVKFNNAYNSYLRVEYSNIH